GFPAPSWFEKTPFARGRRLTEARVKMECGLENSCGDNFKGLSGAQARGSGTPIQAMLTASPSCVVANRPPPPDRHQQSCPASPKTFREHPAGERPGPHFAG